MASALRAATADRVSRAMDASVPSVTRSATLPISGNQVASKGAVPDIQVPRMWASTSSTAVRATWIASRGTRASTRGV